MPGVRYLLDLDHLVARLYGVAPQPPDSPSLQRPMWFVIDPALRLLAVIPFTESGAECEGLLAILRGLPPVDTHAGEAVQAPVLFLPRVFEPELCREMIDIYEAAGGEESGFMREKNGRTVVVHDHGHKRRQDHLLTNASVMQKAGDRIHRRVVPEIAKAHQFHVTRMERYLVACYDAGLGGHFRPHRDNTTAGTAHRRFAVSINLNDDFDGGEIGFPEYGSRTFKPPVGGAVVFSCSLLHCVSEMKRGRRFAFLPFLYDDVAARLREKNSAYVGEEGASYRA